MWITRNGFLFGLAPRGVFPAMSVARHAVRSYRTFSPLLCELLQSGIFSVALSVEKVSPRCYLAR
jgi:hypothetical protein